MSEMENVPVPTKASRLHVDIVKTKKLNMMEEHNLKLEALRKEIKASCAKEEYYNLQCRKVYKGDDC